ncbi:terminase large subunit domain-containing protein, partial [Streptomyces sp. NPDC029674]
MATKNPLDELPVPYDALVELGMSHEQILEAAGKRPHTVAFQADQHPDAWFDVARAQRALRALGAFTHTKGRWAGVHLRLGQGLDPWQVVWILAPVFGWVYFDAELDRVVRVIRRVWVEIPRKNGKSTISSAISGVLLLADQEPGAEVYNAAGSKDQAARVFEDAKRMLSTSKAARSRVEPLKDVVRVPRTASILRVLSSVAETAHGLNVSGAVVDEVHTLRRKAGLVDALETGVGARDQPLLLYITTADEAEDGTPYDEKHTYTLNVASGIISDPSFYGVVWGAEKGDDPFAESTWAKASPGFPKSPNRRYMETEAKKARNSPRELAVFKQLALNLRTSSTSRWLDIGKWDELTARPDRARLRGRRAWAGLDLSATSDFTAWAVWVESTRPGYQLELLIDYWVPEDRVEALQEQLKVPLQAWVDQGYVHA